MGLTLHLQGTCMNGGKSVGAWFLLMLHFFVYGFLSTILPLMNPSSDKLNKMTHISGFQILVPIKSPRYLVKTQISRPCPQRFSPSRSGWGLKFCISNKFLDDADATSPLSPL